LIRGRIQTKAMTLADLHDGIMSVIHICQSQSALPGPQGPGLRRVNIDQSHLHG
jgi:hypothetical protein